MEPKYHPEPYWSRVAEEIESREGTNVIAGDDEPYYVYKRQKFLQLLHDISFEGKSILEIGPGPGGNLLEIWPKRPARLVGADISSSMIKIARSRVDPRVEIVKTNGTSLPFSDRDFDLVFSATVLQHNSDDEMMRSLLCEMTRVSGDQVVLFEQVDDEISGTDLRVARPVAYYADIMREYGYTLVDTQMIDIIASYYVQGAIRKVFNPSSRAEGQPLSPASLALQQLTLPITKVLDSVVKLEKDLARMTFVRTHKA